MLAVNNTGVGPLSEAVVGRTVSSSVVLKRNEILRRLAMLRVLSGRSEDARIDLTLSRNGVRVVLDEPAVKALIRVTPLSITVNETVRVSVPIEGLSALLRGLRGETATLEITGEEINVNSGEYATFVKCASARAVILPRLTSSQACASSLICALFAATSLPDSLGVSPVYVESAADRLRIVSAHPHILQIADTESLGVSFRLALSNIQARAIASMAKGREDFMHFGCADEWIVVGSGYDILYFKQDEKALPDYESELPGNASELVCSATEQFQSVSRRARLMGIRCVSMRPAGTEMSFCLRGRYIECGLPAKAAVQTNENWANVDARYLSAALAGAGAVCANSLVYHHPISSDCPVRLSASGEIGQFHIRYLAAIMPLES